MKKYIALLFFLVVVFGGLFWEQAEAIQSMEVKKPTSVGVQFVVDDTVVPKPKPPLKDDLPSVPTVTNKPVGRLPSTGELITSLIWMVLGLSMLIVIVGVFSLKNIMQNVAWE